MAISAVMCFCAAAADVTITVNEGDPDKTLESTDIAGLGVSDNLVKEGKGRLIIDSGLFDASWTGEVQVNGGYLRVAHVDALGPAGAQGAVVADGATIEFDGNSLNSANLTCAKVAFEGDGVDGESAVRVVGKAWAHSNMAWTMNGDATWGGVSSKGEHFNGGTQSINMGGYTLTARGNGVKDNIYLYFQNDNLLQNPGSIIVDDGLWFITEGTKLLGGDTHTLRFKTSCTWRITNNAKENMTWRLVLDAGVWVSWGASAWVSKWPTASRGWSGPIEIAQGATLSWAPGSGGSNPDGLIACTISGPVSGAGSLWCGNNYLVLDNPNNTIANIANYQGNLYATSLSAVLPSFTNGTFKSHYLGIEGVGTFITVTADDTGPDCDAAKMYYISEHYPDAFLVAGLHTVAKIYLDYAGNEITLSSPVALEQRRYYLGAPYPGIARLTVEDGAVLDAGTGHPTGVGIVVGLTHTNWYANSRGILRLKAGGAITNRVTAFPLPVEQRACSCRRVLPVAEWRIILCPAKW